MTRWFPFVCVALGIAIYRTYLGNPGILDSAIVGAISGGIGGLLSVMSERFLGKHEFKIMDIIDNVLWFLLFCIPGGVLGVIANSPFEGKSSNGFQTFIITSITIIVSAFLTLLKIKSKRKKRLSQDGVRDA